VLTEKPKWFFQKDNVTEKLQCFETIQKLGPPRYIHFLIQYLGSDNLQIRTKAAETIMSMFGKLKTLNDYSDTLKDLPIGESDLDSYRADFDENTYLQLLGIASLNRNGFVREKAIKELARSKNPDGLKFILLRLADWVGPVRKAATEGILSFLETRYIDSFLKELPTIDWLLKVERVDLRELHSKIIEFILSQDFSEEFYDKIDHLDDKTRLRFYKALLTDRRPSKEQVDKICADTNFLVRLELLRHFSSFPVDSQKELIARFLYDRSARVRSDALYASKLFSHVFDSRITELLSDEAAFVRVLARDLLKGKEINFPVLYRRRIDEQKFVLGSLLGLSETGNSEDLPVFERYIHAENSKLVVACLVAINRFDADKAKQYSFELLVHPVKKVRDKAVEISAKGSGAETLNKIRAIYETGDYNVKKTILRLYNKIGGWTIVADLLLALHDESEGIQNLGWQLLEKWKSKATRLFTTPPATEMERAIEIYRTLDQSKLNVTHGRAKLLEDLKFFLR
jgi:HEAT repeat protein